MKKITVILILLLGFIYVESYSQTIVSTTPENRNVVLEEFTGIHCGYCPQGHAIAQSIQNNNPGDVFLINVHQGGYAVPSVGEPDFRTDWGDAIAGQSGLTGYPAGTVNRHKFEGWSQGSGTAMSRGYWEAASNIVLGESSYVNVGVEADINVTTREMTVHVEVYYTGNSPETTNFLNVALLQDYTLGPQAGGDMGDEYVHMHRLVDLVTGQWGEEISPTSSGSFIDKTYTYTIPGDYRDVPAELADLKLVAFITETTQEIVSGNGCYPTYSGFLYSNDASVEEIVIPDEACSPLYPSVVIRNEGGDDITSVTFEYDVNGGETQTYTWTGSISSLRTETVELDQIDFILNGTNTVNVSINNDENTSNNSLSAEFDDAPEGRMYLFFELHTDGYGSECTWNITNSSGEIVESGGPYSNYQTINLDFWLDPGCYTVNILDSYGDGGGSVFLRDSEGTMLFYTNGSYGSGVSQNFTTYAFAPTAEFSPENGVNNIDVETNITITFDQQIRLLDDSEITNGDISSFVTITDPTKGNITFSGTINAEKTELVIDPDQYLHELTNITVTVLGSVIENYYDVEVNEASVTFMTDFYPAANVAFNPHNGSANVPVNTDIVLTFDDPMRLMNDNEITNDDISSFVTLTDPSKGEISYTGTINNEKTVITVNPDYDLPELTNVTVTVSGNSIENTYEELLSESSATFTTEDLSGIKNNSTELFISPNPASESLTLRNAENTTLKIIDLTGKTVRIEKIDSDTFTIDIKSLNKGAYILLFESKDKTVTKNFIKN